MNTMNILNALKALNAVAELGDVYPEFDINAEINVDLSTIEVSFDGTLDGLGLQTDLTAMMKAFAQLMAIEGMEFDNYIDEKTNNVVYLFSAESLTVTVSVKTDIC